MARQPTPDELNSPCQVAEHPALDCDANIVAALKRIIENNIAALEIIQALAAGQIDSADDSPSFSDTPPAAVAGKPRVPCPLALGSGS